MEEVREGGADGGRRNGGGGGQLGVEVRLAAEGQEGDAPGGAVPGQGVERRLPGPPSAEEAHDDGVDAVEIRRPVQRRRRSGPHRRKPVGQHFDRRPQG